MIDADLRLVAWNDRLFELLDFPRHLANVGQPLADFFRYNAERGEYGPGDPDRQVAERLALARRFEAHLFERTRPDGTVLEVRGNPMAGGGFVTTYTDVTERRRAERALQESEERTRLIIDTALDAVVTMDGDGIITGWNPQAERVFGWTRAEAAGRSMVTLIIPPRYRDAHTRGLQRWLATGESRVLNTRIEITALRRDGGEIPVELAITATRSADRLAFSGFIRDLSERRQVESALRERDDQLRQSQKMEALGQLAGGLAHDFNNLMTIVSGRSELLLAALRPEGSIRRNLEVILETAGRATALIDQLLAFGRRQVRRPRVIDLNALVARVATMLHRLIGEHIEIVVVPSARLARVRADPGQLEQVLMNLALNARDAMPGGGRLTLSTADVDTADRGPCVMFAVSDTGMGMDAQTQRRIFEPFFTTKAAGKGTGLGLAMVYGIVEQSDGVVRVESAPGKGSVFKVYLPRTDEALEAETPLRGVSDTIGGHGTILLVEDEVEVRALARDVLVAAGYEVLEAADPEQALALAGQRSGPIDLLLTDVVMPGMSGPDLASRLSGLRREMVVLYMSGYPAEALGAHGVLNRRMTLIDKPFSTQVLLDTIETALASRR